MSSGSAETTTTCNNRSSFKTYQNSSYRNGKRHTFMSTDQKGSVTFCVLSKGDNKMRASICSYMRLDVISFSLCLYIVWTHIYIYTRHTMCKTNVRFLRTSAKQRCSYQVLVVKDYLSPARFDKGNTKRNWRYLA